VSLGYDQRLYLLAFDHRGSFQKMLGIAGRPTSDQLATIRDAKNLIYEGFRHAIGHGLPSRAAGVLVDEEFGSQVAQWAKADRVVLAMPVEKSGQDEFDFEYGESFPAHVEQFDPTFAKVLVRYNPDGDSTENQRQLARLRRLSDWLHGHGRKLLFELLVPPTPAQLEHVGGDGVRFDVETRPMLMVRAIADMQAHGVEPDIWKIEGLDLRTDCAAVAHQARVNGRVGVSCVVLGRGADAGQVDRWLRTGAPVAGYIGFAVGRSIWHGPIKAWLSGFLSREAAAAAIGLEYLRFVDVYAKAAQPPLVRGPRPAEQRTPASTHRR
jgi:myo-inositol catabolism protein IolC